MGKVLAVTSRSAEETRIVGASLAPLLLPGDVISLSGELGAGKTTFVQGLATALGVQTRVTSPTFTIVHEYQGRYPIVHLDVYRLDSFQQVLDLGFEEFLDPTEVVLIEWGDAIAPLLPKRYLEIEFHQADGTDDDERVLYFRPRGLDWIRKLDSMRTTADTLLDAASPEPSEGGGGGRFRVMEDPFARDHMGSHDETEEQEG